MFYIFNYDEDNIGYNISIRGYSLLDINIYAKPIIVLNINPQTYSLI